MNNEHSFVSTDHFEHDLYTSLRTREHTLNDAIVRADINENFEAHLESLQTFDEFYADDIAVSSETGDEPIRGQWRVRSLLTNFLVPFHVMTEIGGLLISIRQTAIPGDASDETHSAWTFDLAGASGRICSLSWCALRKWNGMRVVQAHLDSYLETEVRLRSK